jgi:hypothetical protein
MFDGRISFDGIATVKNFVVGSYFPMARKSRKNSGDCRFRGNLLMQADLRPNAKVRRSGRYRTKYPFPG